MPRVRAVSAVSGPAPLSSNPTPTLSSACEPPTLFPSLTLARPSSDSILPATRRLICRCDRGTTLQLYRVRKETNAIAAANYETVCHLQESIPNTMCVGPKRSPDEYRVKIGIRCRRGCTRKVSRIPMCGPLTATTRRPQLVSKERRQHGNVNTTFRVTSRAASTSRLVEAAASRESPGKFARAIAFGLQGRAFE